VEDFDMKLRMSMVIGALLAVAVLSALFLAVRGGKVSPTDNLRAGGSLSAVAPTQPAESMIKSSPANVEETAAEPIAIPTATAQITRADKSVLEIRAIDGEFARVHVEPNEVLTIRLVLKNFDSGSKVRIDADFGGCLNHRLGPLVIEPKAGDDAVAFQYAVGGHRGKYTLLVLQGARQELFEFWVGPEPQTGQAGPMRVFHPDNT
jgi:hypothetical protein